MALAIVSFTVHLPITQALAVSRRLRLQPQTRRRISRIFRMATLSLGITPSSDGIKDGRIPVELPRDYTLKSHWPDGSGMEAKCRPDFRRNSGRFPVGIVAGFGRNTH